MGFFLLEGIAEGPRRKRASDLLKEPALTALVLRPWGDIRIEAAS